MSKIYSLDDLDTAFPRDSSLRAAIIFEDGTERHVTTNWGEVEFVQTFSGATVKDCYYREDSWTKTLVIKSIRFY